MQAMATAAKDARLQHVIWSTLEDTRRSVPLSDERMPTLMGNYKVPHFDAKGESDHYFTDAGVPTTFLLTSFYWDNLIYFGMGPKKGHRRHARLRAAHGGQEDAGIAAEDIGRCAVRRLQARRRVVAGPLASPASTSTGAQMAAELSKALGAPSDNAVPPAVVPQLRLSWSRRPWQHVPVLRRLRAAVLRRARPVALARSTRGCRPSRSGAANKDRIPIGNRPVDGATAAVPRRLRRPGRVRWQRPAAGAPSHLSCCGTGSRRSEVACSSTAVTVESPRPAPIQVASCPRRAARRAQRREAPVERRLRRGARQRRGEPLAPAHARRPRGGVVGDRLEVAVAARAPRRRTSRPSPGCRGCRRRCRRPARASPGSRPAPRRTSRDHAGLVEVTAGAAVAADDARPLTHWPGPCRASRSRPARRAGSRRQARRRPSRARRRPRTRPSARPRRPARATRVLGELELREQVGIDALARLVAGEQSLRNDSIT